MDRALGTSAGRGRSKAGGRSARAMTRAKVCWSGSTNATVSSGRSIRTRATRAAASRPRSCARRSRPAACVTRAAASFPRSGCRGARSRTRMPSRRSRAGSTAPTGRCWTRSTTTARSSRAGCSRPASPAAIVTSRTPQSFVRRATASACNVTPPANMPRSRTTAMRRRTRRSPARRATCRRAPTWWSTSGTITASAFRVPICP